jgi:site-specific recombinase XerD
MTQELEKIAAQRPVSTRAKSLGELANEFSNAQRFERFRDSKAANTVRTYDRALRQFAQYLAQLERHIAQEAHASEIMPTAHALAHNPQAWRPITHGLVETFIAYLQAQGYARGTINARLSAIKAYSEQAYLAGFLSAEDHAKIQAISSLNRHSDKDREMTRFEASKKPQANTLSLTQVKALQQSIDATTPQGLRDKLLIDLMFAHGLRVSEVARLTIAQVDLEHRIIKDVDRQKVDKRQNIALDDAECTTLRRYLRQLPPDNDGRLISGSLKDKSLTGQGMNPRTIRYRVRGMGKVLGIDNLSPHDLRHTGATVYAQTNKGDIIGLRDWGGWAGLAMPNWYTERAKTVKGLNL